MGPPLLPHPEILKYIEKRTANTKAEAGKIIADILNKEEVSPEVYTETLQHIRQYARIAIHFHPERLCNSGQAVISGLLTDGYFKNQYETGISAGSPTAFPGGARDLWEKQFFGGLYHRPDINPADRPKYGSLILMSHPDGPSPRFGSGYFVLKPGSSQRASFTFGGNQDDLKLEKTGTLKTFDPVMACLLSDIVKSKSTLGISQLTVADFLKRVIQTCSAAPHFADTGQLGGALDSFVEAQIHGPVRLKEDVETLVLDASFRNTKIEQLSTKIAALYDIQLRWHPGFRLPIEKSPSTFRGYSIQALTERIATNGVLTAANIGYAANAFQRQPEDWKEVSPLPEALTYFRRIWHMLVLHGAMHFNQEDNLD